MRLLLVEDDDAVARLVKEALEDDEYAVDHAHDGDEAEALWRSSPYDLAILDVMLPGVDGFTLLRGIRGAKKGFPVLMLTARDALEDRLTGFDSGADDYLVKPFHLAELRARVRALLRRAHGEPEDWVQVGRLELDLKGRRAWWEGREVRLSGREYALLEYLALHRNAHCDRDMLLEHVWPGDASVDPRIVDSYVRFLRRKLVDDAIETTRGLGYRFRG